MTAMVRGLDGGTWHRPVRLGRFDAPSRYAACGALLPLALMQRELDLSLVADHLLCRLAACAIDEAAVPEAEARSWR